MANWIKGATRDKGALHRHLGIPQDKKIPAKALLKALHSRSPKIKKEAVLAKTLSKFR